MSTYGADAAMTQIALGQALRMAKAKQDKLTDKMIEDRTGISKSTFGRYFRGERDITLGSLAALCDALDTTVVDIVMLAQQIATERATEAETLAPKL